MKHADGSFMPEGDMLYYRHLRMERRRKRRHHTFTLNHWPSKQKPEA